MPDANTVAIGAPLNDENGENAGHVRVYSWNGFTWQQKGADINGDTAGDWFGVSVSMPDANTISIGAYRNDSNGSDAGLVRIYRWNGLAWQQKGVDINGESEEDASGNSLSMPDSNTIAIGANYNDGNGLDAGHVRIYKWNGLAWQQKGIDIDGEAAEDRSGHSVDMPDSNTVAIGAVGNDGVPGAGHVRIYHWNGLTWQQKGEDIDGEAGGDWCGSSVSMPDVNTIAVGAKFNDGSWIDAGHVRIFSWDGLTWQQKGVDIDGEAGGDYSGWSVSMSDSNTIAIGAYANDNNGINAGDVRIYTWDGLTWQQKGVDIDGEAAVDYAGWSVSMPDSSTVAIGAKFNDGNGAVSGHVRIYQLLNSNSYISTTDTQQTCESSYTWTDGNTYTTSNNTATDTLMSIGGCDSIITLNLTINAPSYETDMKTACNSYTWIDGNTYTASNNTATHTLTNSTGCDSVVTLDLTITTLNTSTTISGDTINSSEAGTGVNYQWIDCNNGNAIISGAINQSYHPNSNGTYAVILSEGVCTDTSECVTISNIGINENEFEQYINVFPNPSNGLVNIELGDLKDVQVKVFNTTGQLIYQKTNINTSLYQFKLNTVPDLYFIEVYAENAFRRVKLIMD
ncbi:MAG: T9SS type A sorting domain-containing protein [Flavobacteriales bacterium]